MRVGMLKGINYNSDLNIYGTVVFVKESFVSGKTVTVDNQLGLW